MGCVAGALSDQEYLTKLAAAGFENPDIEVTRVYTVEDARDFWAGQSADIKQLARQVDGKFVSGFIRAISGCRCAGQRLQAKRVVGVLCVHLLWP